MVIANSNNFSHIKRKRVSFLYFSITYLLFVGILLTGIVSYCKSDLHLFLTGYHTPFLDTFFRYFTEVGGFIPFVVGALFVLHRLGAVLFILGTQLLNTFLTNGLKLLFSMPRPKTYFAKNFPDIVLHQIDGVTMHAWNSFPSGHTSSAFALMTCIVLITRNKYLSVLYCIVAILAGYSRIYLSQHFAEDVLAGSFTGIVYALSLFPLYRYMSHHYRWQNKLLVVSVSDATSK